MIMKALCVALVATLALGTSVTTGQAAVIASCGPASGYSYFYEDDLGGTAGWTDGELGSTFIFTGTDKVSEVTIKGKLQGEEWTRSASDYGAPVYEVNTVGPIRHVLIIWNGITELYLLNTEKKIFSLVSQKSGFTDVTHVFVGKCE